MSSYKVRKTPGDNKWFIHDRFGMFIHWGLYALPARHEWIKTREKISDEDYQRYFDYFDPDMFDPGEWAKAAKAAGMKYAVFTTKHHEGFCMFDTKYTDYKCTNTKAGRDLVREYVDAFRAQGLKIGFYYSLIDWHHPDFPIDSIHPMRSCPDAYELNKTRDMRRYAEYMRNQVRELLTNYGKIDILWFDFSYTSKKTLGDIADERINTGKGKDDWEAEELIALARSLQPGILIDNRTELEQDIWTPEQVEVKKWPTHSKTGELVPWEACHTFSGSWGYYRDEMTWKSPEMLLKLLIDCVSLGGNLLMNVGPTARGYMDKRAVEALNVYAEWMKYNSRSVYGCTMAEPEFKAPDGVRYTQSEDGKRLYAHLYNYPFKYLQLPGLAGKVKYAQFLHDASELIADRNAVKNLTHSGGEKHGSVDEDMLILRVPYIKPDVVIPVVELFLD
ncbi:MAG: alpha-L-fucosidase [Clostridia bacterium]|nr:alpha-L-fucosidase [Clostridia bacterium]